MKTVVCSVKVKELVEISEKAVLVTCFDGSQDIIPKSQIFGRDYERETESYWIAEWILKRKSLQLSDSKRRVISGYTKPSLFLSPTGLHSLKPVIITHVPEEVKPVECNELESLRRSKQCL